MVARGAVRDVRSLGRLFIPGRDLRKYVDEKGIPQLLELIRKYDPDILWFDTPHKLPPEENLQILKAVRQAKPGIVVNGRLLHGMGDYDSTTDRPAEFTPHDGDWEGIPTTNESYGWNQNDHSHKPPSHFIQLLAKGAARGGNLLLNIGPMGNGRMDPQDVEILRGIGNLHGRLRFGPGKKTDDYVQGWSKMADYIAWPVRLNEAARFEVAAVYDAEASGSEFVMDAGGQELSGTVREGHGQAVSLGQISLLAGQTVIRIKPKAIKDGELMRLRGITLKRP
jgi:hypothetical protein